MSLVKTKINLRRGFGVRIKFGKIRKMKYTINIKRTDNSEIDSQRLKVDGNLYLIEEEGNVPENPIKIRVFDCAREIIRAKNFPQQITLELTVNQ